MRLAPRLWLALAASAALTLGCSSKSSKSSDTPAPAAGDDHPASGPGTPPPGGHPAPAPAPAPPPPGHPAPPPPPPAASPTASDVPPERVAACAAAWQKHASTYKVGLETVYKITTTTTNGSAAPAESSRQVRNTVTEVTADSVSYEIGQKPLAPTEGDEKKTTVKKSKDTWLSDCTNGLVPEGDDGTKVELLGQTTEKLTVAAGSFDTVHAKAKETGADDGVPYQIDREMWTLAGPAADLQIFAKTIDHYTKKMNGQPYVQDQTSELTSVKLP